jgi:chromosome segregation ATPase
MIFTYKRKIMARTGVTYDDVAKAADTLQEAGIEPTVDRVRERLGTGSKSTLAPLLKRWKEQRDVAVAGQGLPAGLLQSVKALYDQVQHSATVQIEVMRQEFTNAEAVISQQLMQVNDELTTLQQQHQILDQEYTALKQAHAQLLEAYKEQQTIAAARTSELAEVRIQLKDAQTSFKETKQELRRVRDNAEHYQQAVAEERRLEREQVQQLRAEWHATREDWNRRLTAEVTAHQAAQHEIQQQLLRNQQLEKLQSDIIGKLDRAQFELQHEQAQQEAQKLQLETLYAERLQTTAELAELRTVRKRIEAANIKLEKRIDTLDQKLNKADDRITQLIEENRLLLQEKADLKAQLNPKRKGS